MNNKDEIMEKLDYEDPRLLDLNMSGFEVVAGTSPNGEDPDAEEGDNGIDDEG